MAMTLRLTTEESEALRRQAEIEGRSMHEVARQAIHDYLTHRRQTRDAILAEIVDEDRELLDRLAR